MAVPAAPDDTTLVAAVGTVRRLRALVAMSHDQQTLASEVGCAYTYVSALTGGHRSQVTVALRESVRRAYERLSMVHGSSERARLKAARLGWAPPLAWDDETIDDPQAVPLTDTATPATTEGGNLAARWLMGESVILDRQARDEIICHLYEWTNSTATEIAERLEMTPGAVEQVWNRIKRKAREAGGPVPWRRVYVPRERTLKKNEMEEAA